MEDDPDPLRKETRMALKVGDKAPEFTLMDGQRQKWSLESVRGHKNVVIAFYLLAFTGG
jgi:peroxiredoxin